MYERMLSLANEANDFDLAMTLQSKLATAKMEQARRAEMTEQRNAPIIKAIRHCLSTTPGGATAVAIQWAEAETFRDVSTHTIVNLLRGMIARGEVQAIKKRTCCPRGSCLSNVYMIVE